MQIQLIAKYRRFFEQAKEESVLVLQGSKRSGKTFAVLQKYGTSFFGGAGKRYQCFSESPKQQNFGLKSDFDLMFKGVLPLVKHNNTQKTYEYKGGKLAFINISDNMNASDIANSLGACDQRYLNEAQMYSRETFEKLLISNTEQFVLDYNPTREFWAKDLINDRNFLQTTWRDNPFLTQSQINLFLEWTEKGQKAQIGSYDYWRWQVICEGNYCESLGEIFTTDNISFISKPEVSMYKYLIFADPSNAKGGDYFALTLTGIGTDGKMYLIDSFSRNKVDKVVIAEQIKKWQKDYPIQRTFIETNGEFGLKFYNDCILSRIPVAGWYSRQDKFERIMANYDVITQKLLIVDNPNNREFAQQIYTFRNPDKKDESGKKVTFNDDNIDCLNNAIMAYITVFGELKILF